MAHPGRHAGVACCLCRWTHGTRARTCPAASWCAPRTLAHATVHVASLLSLVRGWGCALKYSKYVQVNVGDALQALSDGVLKSTFHRVRLPDSGEPVVRSMKSSLLRVVDWHVLYRQCMHSPGSERSLSAHDPRKHACGKLVCHQSNQKLL